ncbi:MAG TPA: site-specific integrase [Bacteroidales bacterium]|nr:site-specific integrase [Bacteroidales bacterium]
MATIRKNKKGKGWVIDYYDLNGTRHRKTLYCTRQKAEQIVKALEGKKANVELGLTTPLKNGTRLKDAVDDYLSIAKNQKKQTTIDREELVYNAFQAYIGEDTQIGKIRHKDIVDYINKRYEVDNISPATTGVELRVLRLFFNTLIQNEYIKKNPCDGVKAIKQQDKKIRFLTTEEIKKLFKMIDDKNYEDLFKMYLHTGARKSEILAPQFTWDDVDFKSRRIRIVGKGDKHRSVPMNDTVYEILKRRKVKEKREYPFSFDYDYLYKKFKKYVKKAKLENVTLHTLRKTYGSLLVQNGVDIFTVSKLLGHSSVTVTESHYADLVEKNLADGVKVLDKIL